MSCSSGIGSWSRSRKTFSSCSVSFFAWWVMLRPSTPVPSVQPLTVLARIAVGCPWPWSRVVGGVDLAVVVAAAPQRTMSSSDRSATISSSRGSRPKKCSRMYAPVSTEYFCHSPSSVSFMRSTSTPSTSRASRSSHSRAQITLMTFQPAPRKTDSSSWMILPLPRTGPSSRCRLQLTTKVRLSRPSRAAMDSEPSRLGLVGLAVAEERPDAVVRGVLDAACWR